IVVGTVAVALPMRNGCPARQPSPKKSPGPSIATTASRPVFDTTDSLMPPDWMYMTCSQGSPCVNTASPRPYLAIVFATPDDSRNCWASNADVGLAAAFESLGAFRPDFTRPS